MQSGAQIVQAGGVTVSPGSRSTACKAFKAAAEAWCDDKGDRKGSFNDYYFAALNETKPGGSALAEQMEREVPFLGDKSGGVNALEDIANSAKEGSHADLLGDFEAGLREDAEGGAISWDSYRNTMKNAMGGMGQSRFPDAMLGDQVVEIKGPGDEFGDGQLEDYSKINPKGSVWEISCESCGADCAENNECP